jgi:hypothetical protein
MLKKIITFLLVAVSAFATFSCKSKAVKPNEKNQTLAVKSNEKKQTLEMKAAMLAVECIRKEGNVDNEKYKDCVAASISKALAESDDPADAEKFNKLNTMQSVLSEVDALVKAALRNSSLPENQGRTSPYKGYGSPNVKQVLVDNDMFLIKEFSTDSTYGYTESNPIMVGGAKENIGPINERRFLNALAGPLGFPVFYKRLGSCCPFYTKNGNDVGDGQSRGLLDVYEVHHDSMNEPVKLYINMYDSDVLKVPVGGFTIRKK